ncbi:MAG: MTH938/NDUFAF3 family protein [Chloroflexota bacterium]
MSDSSHPQAGPGTAPPRIEECRFGWVVIDGRRYTRDVIVFPDHVLGDWWREQGHVLSPSDLQSVLDDPPEILVVGLGHLSRMHIRPEATDRLKRIGVQVIDRATPEACETYNRLRLDRRVVAALHLTC